MSKGKNAKYVPAKQSNTLTYVLGGIAVLVVIVVVIGGVFLLSKKEAPKDANAIAGQLNAASPMFVLGKADAPTTLDFFEDPMCPACGAMEAQFGEKIVSAIESGKVRARYHMVSFLNRQSHSGDYSDRANAALLAISKSSLPDDQKQKALLGAHTALFGKQPEEGGATDHTNAELATIVGDGAKAKGVTLPADVTDAISQGKYVADAASSAKASSALLTDIGGSGTPTVVHDGKILSDLAGELTPLLG